MSDHLWKQTERKLAKLLGGKRVPVHSTDGIKCDITCPVWSVECKERKSLPSWLLDAMGQAEANQEKGKLAMLVLHRKGDDYKKALVILSLEAFLGWYG